MVANTLIYPDFPVVTPDDNALTALTIMDDYKIRHLPLIDAGNYVALLTEEHLFDLEAPEEKFSKQPINRQFRPYATEEMHILEMQCIMEEANITILPILNKRELYLGAIPQSEMLHHLSTFSSIGEEGSILLLRVNSPDYTLSQIAQIVESNDAKIVHLTVNKIPDSTELQVTLKINHQNVLGIVQTFSRYGYTIEGAFATRNFQDDLDDRYQSLMNYLNV